MSHICLNQFYVGKNRSSHSAETPVCLCPSSSLSSGDACWKLEVNTKYCLGQLCKPSIIPEKKKKKKQIISLKQPLVFYFSLS